MEKILELNAEQAKLAEMSFRAFQFCEQKKKQTINEDGDLKLDTAYERAVGEGQ